MYSSDSVILLHVVGVCLLIERYQVILEYDHELFRPSHSQYLTVINEFEKIADRGAVS